MIDNINKNSFFWNYLSKSQKGLIEESLYLLEDSQKHPDVNISDYSYLVFPLAKAYEGFLKQIFLDLNFIKIEDYQSDHFRIGKVLNPHLDRKHRYQSVYDKFVKIGRKDLGDELWLNWKKGRNLVFHYFPHNLKALSLIESEEIIFSLLSVMEKIVSLNQDKLTLKR